MNEAAKREDLDEELVELRIKMKTQDEQHAEIERLKAALAPSGGSGSGVEPHRYERVLPSGRVAHFLRNITGDHMARACRVLGPQDSTNPILLGWGLASIVAKVDGTHFLIEDRGQFTRDDYLALSTEAMAGKG